MKNDRVEEITKLLMQYRTPLYAYVLAIVRDEHMAEDVLQEASVVIVRRREEIDLSRDFWRFARGVAKRQALSALREKKRSHVTIPTEVLETIDRGFDELSSEIDDRRTALKKCVELLPESWRRLVNLRHWKGLTIGQISIRQGKSENVVSVTLVRIHKRLADCVRRRLHSEAVV
jgi:RNA polymerase sigma-70 factor (ECF subfamily)